MSDLSRPVIGVLAVQGDVREHRAALEELGATPHHRQTFLGLQFELEL